MNFKADLLAKVLDGTKTQTRRIARAEVVIFRDGGEYHYGGDHPIGDPIQQVYGNTEKVGERKQSFLRYEVGKDYAAAPGRGKFQQGRIKIIAIRHECLSAISEEDARAEGFANRAEFFEAWDRINGKGKRDVDVWVITFELVKEPERLL